MVRLVAAVLYIAPDYVLTASPRVGNCKRQRHCTVHVEMAQNRVSEGEISPGPPSPTFVQATLTARMASARPSVLAGPKIDEEVQEGHLVPFNLFDGCFDSCR